MTVSPGWVPEMMASTCAGVKRTWLSLAASRGYGPVFGGLYMQPDGSSKIKLVAVQTGWKDTIRTIVACPIDPFLVAVERLINENEGQVD